jgi:hypothetical protein
MITRGVPARPLSNELAEQYLNNARAFRTHIVAMTAFAAAHSKRDLPGNLAPDAVGGFVHSGPTWTSAITIGAFLTIVS